MTGPTSPMVCQRSPSGCGSGLDKWSGSSNTSTAVSNDRPCLARLPWPYRGPTSNALPLRGCSYKYDVTGVKILSRRSSVAGLRGSAIGGILANARFGDVSGTTVEVLAIVPKSEAESWLAQFGNPE